MSNSESKPRTLTQERKARGLCTRCGKSDERVQSGKVLCAQCAAYARDTHKRYYQRMKQSGRCPRCGGKTNVYVMCFQCRNEVSQYNHKRKRSEENGKEH